MLFLAEKRELGIWKTLDMAKAIVDEMMSVCETVNFDPFSHALFSVALFFTAECRWCNSQDLCRSVGRSLKSFAVVDVVEGVAVGGRRCRVCRCNWWKWKEIFVTLKSRD